MDFNLIATANPVTPMGKLLDINNLPLLSKSGSLNKGTANNIRAVLFSFIKYLEGTTDRKGNSIIVDLPSEATDKLKYAMFVIPIDLFTVQHMRCQNHAFELWKRDITELLYSMNGISSPYTVYLHRCEVYNSQSLHLFMGVICP